MTSRRTFLKLGALAGTSFMLRDAVPSAWAVTLSGSPVRKFIVPLPGLGPTGLPVATPDQSLYPGVDYYNITMGEFSQWLHPDLPGATKLWGYADVTNGRTANFRYLGGAIVAQKNRPVRIKFSNQLPNKHPLPVDNSLMGAEADQPVNRAAPHLHGGFVPWVSDGNPFSWFTPDGTKGQDRLNWLRDKNGNLTDDNWYPNAQSSRLMWYHDHALGITRLNAYAGLATAYILRDNVENALIDLGAIPGKVPGTEVPLIIQDKAFKTEADQFGNPGDLDYPVTQDEADVEPGHLPLPNPSCVPEFFATTMLVNGAPYPFLEVQQRRYRFRILNACQARFLNLQLYFAKNDSPNEANLGAPGPAMIQIGTEGGFLPRPVVLNQPPLPLTLDPNSGLPTSYTLLLAPAERADLIIDFSNVPTGAKLILYNDAVAPFPSGDPAEGGPDASPDTQNILRFQVVPRVGPRDPNLSMPPVFIEPLPVHSASRIRHLTLNEDVDEFGRLIQRLGTDQQMTPGTFALNYMDPATEVVQKGSTEIWAIYNTTMDTHPIHFHLVNVQVLGRQAFKLDNKKLHPVGPTSPPDDNERGWKETVRMNPGQVTYVIMKFDLPKGPAGVAIPNSPRTGGLEYVWHCHILEHEEHDMMRPLVVK